MMWRVEQERGRERRWEGGRKRRMEMMRSWGRDNKRDDEEEEEEEGE